METNINDSRPSGERRLATVLEHMRLENDHALAECIAVFGHPRYEIVPTGEVHDGAAGVAGLLAENKSAFADFHFEPSRVAPAGDAVLVEGLFTGTHTGKWRGLPATGRRVVIRMAVIFEFQGEALVCERVYFDLATALRQLGVARDPMTLAGKITTVLNHPVVIARALLWGFIRRLRPKPA